jgi:type VI secretion system FHA domain protein
MRLILELKGPERLMRARPSAVVDKGAIVVGRAETADWTIPDPERVISKQHCRIERDFSGFVLTDTSTNGVRVNDEPVGYGLPRQLADGDVIMLGDAVVVARIAAEAPADTPPAAPAKPEVVHAPVAMAPLAPAAVPVIDGPFGPSEAAATTPGQGSGQNGQAPASRLAEPVLDDWWTPEAPAPATPAGSAGAAIPVDISVPASEVAIVDTFPLEESIPSLDEDTGSLLRAAAGVELGVFVGAVEAAAGELAESERQKFEARLRQLLREHR